MNQQPTSLAPPVPKPRLPPKPGINPVKSASAKTATGKPSVPPKPRRIPPSIPTLNTNVKADHAEDVPKRPLKPAYLSSNTTKVQNVSEKTIPDQDDLYDDVNVHPTSELCIDRPQLPLKPTLKPSEDIPSSGLTVKLTPSSNPSLTPSLRLSPNPSPTPSPRLSPNPSPTPSPRLSPNPSPTPSPRLSPNPSPTPSPRCSPTSDNDITAQPSPRPRVTAIKGGSNDSKEAVKKRIASRRQLNSHNVTRTLPADVKCRRPPPPPPTNNDVDPQKGGALKGPPVTTGLDRVDETIPKTAEEQSLYSYAYEHTVVATATMPANYPHPQISHSEDNTYVEPDANAVSSFMEELKHKEAISTGEYEVYEEDEQEDNTYVEPDANAVNSFVDKAISSGQYEIPAEDKQEGTIEQGSIDSSEAILVDQVTRPDDEHLEGSSGESSDCEEYHEYEYPVDSPPPVPPHGKIHSLGSYDVNPIKDKMLKEEEEEEEEEDDLGEYVEPPDTQGTSEDYSDEDAFLGEDDDESVEEPLYQIYAARTLQKDRTLSRKRTSSDQQTETFIDDLTKGTLRNMRMLWCEIPEVVSSGILDTIDPEERKRQEAMFEVITSEASYLKSINILESHFINSPELTPGTAQSVLEKAQHHILFSNVRGVVETSQRFLEALRKRQTESLVILSISDILEEFATKQFEVYVKYCSNQLYQDRVLKELSKEPRYVEAIQRLERCSTAQCLSMHSFLVLPMQRITRLPLLVDAICHRCEPGSDEFIKTDAALKAVNKVVQNCNEGARKMERMEEMLNLQPQIEFVIKPIALVTTNRWLLRRGEVVLVIEQSKNPLSKKKLKLKPVYMFLFNDLLLITKKKGERRYRVLDYAARHLTKVEESTDTTIQLDYMLSLILLENSNGKTKDFTLCAESETDKTRWLEAFNPPKGEQEGEKVYGAWDCPQVQVIHDYTPQQPDELALHEGDVINVQRKLPDGWYYGERLCDGVCGWFPANYTENIRNEHVRARNLLQRYRLLAASKHLLGAVQTMKPPKTSKLTKGIMKRDTIS